MRAVATALLGLALVVAALMFDIEPLYAPGAAFVLLGVLTPTWLHVAAHGARVTRSIGVRTVLEDEPLAVSLTVHAGALPPLGARVVDALVPAGVPVPLIAPGGAPAELRLAVPFARRGRRRLGPPRLVLSDPLGLARATVTGEGEDEVLVLPRFEPVRFAAHGGAGRPGGAPLLVAGAAVELDGLRPYREGAPASRIHWPAYARGAGLIERRLRDASDARPLVVLDARAPARAEDLDAAVRAAASLVHELARRGGCALLLPGDRRPIEVDGERGWPAAHARLALVETDPERRPPAPIVGQARRGPVLCVCARALTRLPPSVAKGAFGARYLVVPGTLAGRTAAFSVAGCSGYALSRGRGEARTAAPVRSGVAPTYARSGLAGVEAQGGVAGTDASGLAPTDPSSGSVQ